MFADCIQFFPFPGSLLEQYRYLACAAQRSYVPFHDWLINTILVRPVV